jgi:hypothetical protein
MTATERTQQRVLNIDNMNPLIKNVEYAVRGKLAIRAEEIRTDLEKGKKGYPFDKVVNCNIGNPQQFNQAPITFFRQVSKYQLSLMAFIITQSC